MRNKLVRMSWSTRLTLVAAVAFIGLIITVAIALDTLRVVQIRGALYEEIRLAQDLRADILPPPNYLVDATAQVATASVYALRGEFAKAQAEMQRYEQARRDYFARYEFWQKHLQEPDLRKTLLQEAHPPAVQIFALVEREFKPALARGNRRAVERAYARIHQLFQRHKAAIDQAVVQSEEWAKRVEARADAVKQARTKLLWSVALVVIALVAYGSFVLFRMGRSLTNATKQLHSAIQHLQQGDLLYRIPVSGNDEMAQLLAAYNHAADQLAQAFTETRQAAKLVLQGVQGFIEGLNTVAQGAHAVGTTVAESAQGAESLAHELQRITESVSQVQLAAHEVAQGAEQTAQSAAAGVERVNLITQRIQTAFTELQQVQHESEQASQITHEGRIALQRSEQVMREIEAQTRRTAQELQQLAEMSNSVSKIVSKIEDIARQINLLSLNAAIEAARAGEAGRGFAVVADEVRRLAERSALSSQEIQQILEQVVTKTHEAVAAMEESLKVVQEGSAVSQQVAAGLQTILQAVDSIAEQVRHSAELMQEVQLSSEATLGEIEQIAAIAEQSSAASEQMLASAETTAHALQQMAALSEQAAANAQQSSHIVQQQVAAIQQLNQNASKASATVERLMFSLGRFRVSDEESFEEKIATFKRAHLKWVERVERMVHHGEMIPRDQLVSHQKCALGTWYYSIGQQMYGHLPEFQAIEPPHERLHQIAAQAVEAVERGDRARAEQLLEEIRGVSTEIVSWLDKLYTRVTTRELRQAA